MRVVIADDAVLLREGVASLLTANGFDVVTQVGSAEELLDAVERDEPDVAVVDVRMPPTHTDEGIRAVERLADSHPNVGALVLSQYVEATFVLRLLEHRTHGRGYLVKDQVGDVDTLIDAVRTVGEGGSFVDPDIVRRLLARDEANSSLASLSDREREVLRLMAEGRSNRSICEQLYVSPKTVETHIRNVFSKLGLGPDFDDDRRVMAVLRYLRAT
jgi:DNA-binding NarL/FixJ family response regulator